MFYTAQNEIKSKPKKYMGLTYKYISRPKHISYHGSKKYSKLMEYPKIQRNTNQSAIQSLIYSSVEPLWKLKSTLLFVFTTQTDSIIYLHIQIYTKNRIHSCTYRIKIHNIKKSSITINKILFLQSKFKPV